MTLREYRKGDWVGVVDLWRRNPTEEFPLLGMHPEAMGSVFRRLEGFGPRFVLGLARLFGRPVFIILVLDLDGRVAGTTLVNFPRETAYLSYVIVDSSLRRQGHAQSMLRAADELARKYHRTYVTLDVLSQNEPAVRLYERWGYQPLRDQLWLVRAFSPESPLPPPSGTTLIRPYQARDGPVLAELDNALMSPEVRRVLPRHVRDFRTAEMTGGVLQSDTRSWVTEIDGRPVGFLQSTVSRLMDAANLSSPLFGADVPDSVARDLFLTALRWTESQRAPRVLTQVSEHQWRRRPLLDSLGFVEHFRMHTLVHRLGA
jgi:ribosomal protein S18 acetylase RimI-like enzyme